MNEGAPKEDINSIPNDFKLKDYYNEFSGFVSAFRDGTNFSEILKYLKKSPIMTVEKYLNNPDTKDKDDYEQKVIEFKAHPGKMSRLNQIVAEINSLNEDEEEKFKTLVKEVSSLLVKNAKSYFI
jgi:hypothetical protein